MQPEKEYYMENVSLRKAIINDKVIAVELDYKLDKKEHIELKREQKIIKAILDEECFIILVDDKKIGFVIFDYRFFDKGWIELIIIDEEHKGKGIGGKVFDLICEHCKSDKIFTSTNSSNIQMQKALTKADFTFAGELNGLDEGDPERFYFKKLTYD